MFNLTPKFPLDEISFEGGDYMIVCSMCGNTFIGFKRQCLCKKCVEIKKLNDIENNKGFGI